MNYLVFTSAEKPYWWTRFLKDGFHHCYMIVDLVDQRYIIEQTFEQMNVIRLGSACEHIPPRLDKPSLIITLPDYEAQKNTQLFRPFTCVEICKSLMGLRRPFIQTPKQLFDFCVNDLGCQPDYLESINHGWKQK